MCDQMESGMFLVKRVVMNTFAHNKFGKFSVLGYLNACFLADIGNAVQLDISN